MPGTFLHGTVHEAADDLQSAIRADPNIVARWEKLTPIARNEFICWVEDAKQPATRQPYRANVRGVAGGQEAPLLLAGLHPPHRQGAKPIAASDLDRQEAPPTVLTESHLAAENLLRAREETRSDQR